MYRWCIQLKAVYKHEIFALLGYYIALNGSWLLVFWDSISIPSSKVLQCQ